jgi:hypothetical protein
MTSVRRGTATKLAMAFGRDDVRLLLAHNPVSKTLQTNYDLPTESRDLVSAMLAGEAAIGIDPKDQLSATR